MDSLSWVQVVVGVSFDFQLVLEGVAVHLHQDGRNRGECGRFEVRNRSSALQSSWSTTASVSRNGQYHSQMKHFVL